MINKGENEPGELLTNSRRHLLFRRRNKKKTKHSKKPKKREDETQINEYYVTYAHFEL